MNPKLTTRCYKVLEAIYDNQLIVVDKKYCPLGQNEIAKIIGCNRMTINNALKELYEEGYVICEKQQYVLTDKGTDTVTRAKDIE